jgi:hypothetical protein
MVAGKKNWRTSFERTASRNNLSTPNEKARLSYEESP